MISDEIAQQKAKLKKMTPAQRLGYFWYYHKTKVFLILAVLLLLIYLAAHVYSRRNGEYLYIALVNTDGSSDSKITLLNDYLADRQIDDSQCPSIQDDQMVMHENEVTTLSLSYSQKLQVLMESGDMDVLIADKWIADDFASQSLLCDLEKTLPGDLLSKVKDDLYYHTWPNGEKAAIAFYADRIPKVGRYYDSKTRPLVMIDSVSDNRKVAVDFLRYILEDH